MRGDGRRPLDGGPATGGVRSAPGLGARIRQAIAGLTRGPASQATLHVRIDGAVQGVGFRRWAQREADRLGLAGWVANRADGAVEVAATGPVDAVAALRAALHRGPSRAVVRAVDELPTPPETTLPRPFAIVRGGSAGASDE